MKAKSLQDLQTLRQHLADQERIAKEEAARKAEAKKKADAERNLFQRAAGKVEPLRHEQRVRLAGEQPAPIPVQRQLDDQRVLREAISNEFDAGTLLEREQA